jgi:hypothetical protein
MKFNFNLSMCRAIRQITCIRIYHNRTMLWIPHSKRTMALEPLARWQDKTMPFSINRSQHRILLYGFFFTYISCQTTHIVAMIFFCISFIKLCNGKLCIRLFAKTDMVAVWNGYQENLNDLKVPENKIFVSGWEAIYWRISYIVWNLVWL